MAKVILDTNFLVVPFTHAFSLDVEMQRIIPETIEYMVLDASLREAQSLQQEKLIQTFIKHKNITVIQTNKTYADKAILAYCKKNPDVYVATQDAKLRASLKQLGIRVIFVRSKTHLEVE
ncbi:MAG: hypothetical protein ACMXYF_04945 [Candidatus Woesearchaeota archaeon]